MLRNRFFRSAEIPSYLTNNYKHLIYDMGWFGVLSGSTISFLAIFAARLGANPIQIGLLAALPATVNLFFAIPASNWLEKRPINKAVFLSSIYFRFGYLLLIALPWLFSNEIQIWTILVIILLMSIPGTATSVGFNEMFAEAVPSSWRAHFAGTRNMVLSIVFVLTSIICGAILNFLPFPVGYQVVFSIGFIGAMMSSYHLYKIQPLERFALNEPSRISSEELPISLPVSKSLIVRIRNLFRFDVWKTPYRRILLILLFFHFVQYLLAPVYTIYVVKNLNLNDQQIGIGTAAFYITVFLGSFQLSKFSRRLSHRSITGIGVLLMGLYPIFLSFSTTFYHFLVTSLVGGIAWALAGGALVNYLLDKIPTNERPTYLAWYNIILNAGILAGSLLGPLISGGIGITSALFVFGICRLVAGFLILKWG